MTMQSAQTDRDLVVARGDYLPGIPIPPDMASLPTEQLRWNGAVWVDAASITEWAIDPQGRKRLPVSSDPDWPVLTCAWEAVVVPDATGWHVETDADRLQKQRQAASMPKPAFLAAAFRQGALTKGEAVEAGQGGWPVAFEPALTNMTDEEQVEARAQWNAVANVLYGYPTTNLVAEIGAARTGRTTTDLLDAIFGIG